MHRYLIERQMAIAGNLSEEQLKKLHKHLVKYCIEWASDTVGTSYATDKKLYCLYNTPNLDMIMEHASYNGFPAKVIEVKTIINPVTAEQLPTLILVLYRLTKTLLKLHLIYKAAA